MLEEIPYFRLGEAMPDAVARLLGSLPALKPVIPDPGTRFQLVHEDDVAWAFVAGVRGVGEPGPYNLAGGGTLTFSRPGRRARAGTRCRCPRLAVDATAEIATRLPLAARAVGWLHSVRKPVLMKTDRARRSSSRWTSPKRRQRCARLTARGEIADALERRAVQLRVVLLAHLARVQQRRAVAHRAFDQRRDALLGHADLGQARRQAEPPTSSVTWAASAGPTAPGRRSTSKISATSR